MQLRGYDDHHRPVSVGDRRCAGAAPPAPEKYAILWLTVVLTVVPLAIFPRLLDRIAGALGVESGTSLVCFLALTVLLAICAHLTWEVNRLDEQVRALAERIALMSIEVPEATCERR